MGFERTCLEEEMEAAAMAEEAQTAAIFFFFFAKRLASNQFVLCLNGLWRWVANLLMLAGAYLKG